MRGIPLTQTPAGLREKKMKYKYVSENPNLIKSGTTVMFNGEERIIEEASDKTLRLKGDRIWINISDYIRNLYLWFRNPISTFRTPTTCFNIIIIHFKYMG